MRQYLHFFLAFLAVSFGFAQIPTNGLIKDYKFTNGVLTSDVTPLLQVGNTTLIPTGNSRTTITDRNSETNKAITLNGDSFTAGGTNASSVNNYAVSFWVKTTTNESPKRFILDQHNTGTNPAGYSVSLKDGKIYFNGQCSWNFNSSGNNSGVRQVISPTINDGLWHHVVCQVGSTISTLYAGGLVQYTLTYTYTMYIDNTLVGSDSETDYASGLITDAYSVRGITPTQQLVIGKSPSLSYLDYQDSIDQIRYYERTLTPVDIDALYNEDRPPVTLYVNPNATGLNNGTSWTNAFTSLDAAITSATSTNEIWVVAGTYKPTGSSRTSTFNMKNGLKLYGGFNGTETMLSQRNPKTNITILSGDLNGNDNTTITATEPTRQDNAYHVITVKGNLKNIRIDGFTISGGNANGPTLTTGTASAQYYHTRGGAIYVNTFNSTDGATISIKNCILEKNSGSDTGVSAGYFASGITNQSYRTDFETCIIRNNFSGANSQILISGANGYNWFAYGKIENCLFNNNTSTSGASCLYLSASETNSGNQMGIRAEVINTTFASNTGTSGQVIRSHNASNCIIRNSIIYNNGSNTPFVFTGLLGGPALNNTISQGGQISGINSNPLFNTDFTLQASSPAINTGNNSYLTSGITTDLNGNSRYVDTTIDMGAFEYDVALSTSTIYNYNEFKVFPNPASNEIFITCNENLVSIKLFTLDGRQILETQNKYLSISELPSGIYLLVIVNDKGQIGNQKIIKK